jgi:hypothetical protein
MYSVQQQVMYKINSTTTDISSITHSLPQPAFHTHPEQPWSPPQDGLPPYCPPESLSWLASLARCGNKELPLCLRILAQYGPRPGHGYIRRVVLPLTLQAQNLVVSMPLRSGDEVSLKSVQHFDMCRATSKVPNLAANYKCKIKILLIHPHSGVVG